MTEITDTAGVRDRSPAYPNVPLKVALDRLGEFDAHFKRSPARSEKIGDAWGIKGKAYVDRIAAALRYFGLLEYQSTETGRQIVVSEDGRKYLRSQQEDTKREVIKAAALRPKQIATFWKVWGPDRPADPACIDQLAFNGGFSDKGARDFLKVYDATISFAGLSASDKKELPEEDQAVDRGEEATVMHPGVEQSRSPALIPPASNRAESDAFEQPQRGARREVITLDEGDVVITFPADLSSDSFGDLKDHLDLFIKKMQRRAARREDG